MTTDARQPKSNPRTNKMARRSTRERFLRVRKSGKTFERQLAAVAKQIGLIVQGFAPNGVVDNAATLAATLQQYADTIRPWARSVAERMIAEVNQRDDAAWVQMGKEVGRGLRRELRSASVKPFMREMLEEQVELITSLSVRASRRVHKLSMEALADGGRAKEVAKEILRSGEVSKSQAALIARTEVARTASTLMMARAESVGSVGYIWRTSKDSDVRHRHKKLEGKYFRYDAPPVSGESGERAHPGMIYNCRCWMEPIIPD